MAFGTHLRLYSEIDVLPEVPCSNRLRATSMVHAPHQFNQQLTLVRLLFLIIEPSVTPDREAYAHPIIDSLRSTHQLPHRGLSITRELEAGSEAHLYLACQRRSAVHRANLFSFPGIAARRCVDRFIALPITEK